MIGRSLFTPIACNAAEVASLTAAFGGTARAGSGFLAHRMKPRISLTASIVTRASLRARRGSGGENGVDLGRVGDQLAHLGGSARACPPRGRPGPA